MAFVDIQAHRKIVSDTNRSKLRGTDP